MPAVVYDERRLRGVRVRRSGRASVSGGRGRCCCRRRRRRGRAKQLVAEVGRTVHEAERVCACVLGRVSVGRTHGEPGRRPHRLRVETAEGVVTGDELIARGESCLVDRVLQARRTWVNVVRDGRLRVDPLLVVERGEEGTRVGHARWVGALVHARARVEEGEGPGKGRVEVRVHRKRSLLEVGQSRLQGEG